MRISDWSSDVCSSDRPPARRHPHGGCKAGARRRSLREVAEAVGCRGHRPLLPAPHGPRGADRGYRGGHGEAGGGRRSEEHTSALQSLMRISYAVFCLKKKKSDITIYKHKIEQL